MIKLHGGQLMRWRGARLDVCESPRGLRATWGPDGAPIRDPYAVGVLWMRGLPSYGIDAPSLCDWLAP